MLLMHIVGRGAQASCSLTKARRACHVGPAVQQGRGCLAALNTTSLFQKRHYEQMWGPDCWNDRGVSRQSEEAAVL